MFHKEPIKFKIYTKKRLFELSLEERIKKIDETIRHNVQSLQRAIDYCYENGIESYRVGSDLISHYDTVKDIVDLEPYFELFREVDTKGINLSMHPGQYCIINSPKENVVENSLKDLHYHKLIADCLGFKELNIHVGGVYGDKASAIQRFIDTVNKNPWLKDYLTIENDELSFCADDCLYIANEVGIPFTFDLHHERCYWLNEGIVPDVYNIFERSSQTWSNRDHIRIHISSPKDGYTTPSKSRPHSDYITESDIVKLQSDKTIYVDVEAKHKEVAVKQFKEHLSLI